jgi:hypothetical protein
MQQDLTQMVPLAKTDLEDSVCLKPCKVAVLCHWKSATYMILSLPCKVYRNHLEGHRAEALSGCGNHCMNCVNLLSVDGKFGLICVHYKLVARLAVIASLQLSLMI